MPGRPDQTAHEDRPWDSRIDEPGEHVAAPPELLPARGDRGKDGQQGEIDGDGDGQLDERGSVLEPEARHLWRREAVEPRPPRQPVRDEAYREWKEPAEREHPETVPAAEPERHVAEALPEREPRDHRGEAGRPHQQDEVRVKGDRLARPEEKRLADPRPHDDKREVHREASPRLRASRAIVGRAPRTFSDRAARTARASARADGTRRRPPRRARSGATPLPCAPSSTIPW